MTTFSKISAVLTATRMHYLTPVMLAAFLAVASPALAENSGHAGFKNPVAGSWYIALDAGPFNPALAGTFLAGLAQFHSDRTFTLVDAGDFGAQSFIGSVATAQYGTWKWVHPSRDSRGWSIRGTALHLEGDKETGEVFGWNRIQFDIQIVDGNRMQGTINGFFLPCDNTVPLPSPLACPDPIANAAAFLPATPPDVPIFFTRIVAD